MHELIAKWHVCRIIAEKNSQLVSNGVKDIIPIGIHDDLITVLRKSQ